MTAGFTVIHDRDTVAAAALAIRLRNREADHDRLALIEQASHSCHIPGIGMRVHFEGCYRGAFADASFQTAGNIRSQFTKGCLKGVAEQMIDLRD